MLVLPFEPVTPTTRSRPPRRTRSTTPRGEAGQGGHAVVDDDHGDGEVERTLGDDDRGTGGDGPVGEEVAVGLVPAQGEEHGAGRHEPGVGLDRPVDDLVGVGTCLGEVQGTSGHLGQLGQREGDHSAHPASRSAARASSRAEYGVRSPRMSR